MNYYSDKVLHPFAKVSRQNQLFTEILISKEYFFFSTRSGENRFLSSLDREKKGKGEREIYILMLQISEFYMGNFNIRMGMQTLNKMGQPKAE